MAHPTHWIKGLLTYQVSGGIGGQRFTWRNQSNWTISHQGRLGESRLYRVSPHTRVADDGRPDGLNRFAITCNALQPNAPLKEAHAQIGEGKPPSLRKRASLCRSQTVTSIAASAASVTGLSGGLVRTAIGDPSPPRRVPNLNPVTMKVWPYCLSPPLSIQWSRRNDPRFEDELIAFPGVSRDCRARCRQTRRTKDSSQLRAVRLAHFSETSSSPTRQNRAKVISPLVLNSGLRASWPTAVSLKLFTGPPSRRFRPEMSCS